MSARVLLLCDRPNWAYDAIARALVRHNDDPTLELVVAHLKGNERGVKKEARRCDVVFALGWQLLGEFVDGRVERRLTFLDPSRTLTGIHSHHAWDERRSLPERSVAPPPQLIEFLSQFAGVNAVSSRLTRLFRDAGLSDVRYTPNGVDTALFRPTREVGLDGAFVVGFSGSAKHDWRKGTSELIEPASRAAGVGLRVAMPTDGHHVPLEEMPRFYNEIDAYVCASTSEGFSLSVLEASACGRPVISTRVGGSEDLIDDGVNGFLVDRTVDAIRARIELLASDRALARELGERNRAVVEERWSWVERACDWIAFVRDHVR